MPTPSSARRRIDEGAITFEKIQKAVAETPAKFYTDLVEDITQAGEEFRRFCVSLSERSGFDAPSSDLVGVLEAYLDVVKDLARDKLVKAPAHLRRRRPLARHSRLPEPRPPPAGERRGDQESR